MASTEDEVKDSINIIMEVVYEERKKEKLKHDVDYMSQLLWSLLAKCNGRPKSLPEKIKQHFKDIYWSLRLHLEFHFGGDAVDLENLRKVGEYLELDTGRQPGVECAIDPGSKLLEIVSKGKTNSLIKAEVAPR
ncbi:MAG: hypothetical protein MI923_16950 [Phycisphaerales bacterium]|nr:hypothetical protein [Phycisphaerales bacterium]